MTANETREPDAPESDAPGSVAPESDAPGSVAPESDGPGSAAPESDGPESTAADTAAAETEDGRTLRTRIESTRDRIRSDPRDRAVALAVAALLGLVFAWIHWLGLVAGGALVGLVAPRLRRAPLYAMGFGALVLLAFAATVWSSLSLVVAMEPIVYVTVGAAIGLPLLGSLARGVA